MSNVEPVDGVDLACCYYDSSTRLIDEKQNRKSKNLPTDFFFFAPHLLKNRQLGQLVGLVTQNRPSTIRAP